MQCTTLCPAHLCSYTLDCALAEPEWEIKEEQVQGVFGGPEASSCEDINIFLLRQAPVYLTSILEFCLPLYLNYDSYLCIRL
jgi:hypothetical protein